MTPVTQAEINKAAWGACDTFRGVVDPSEDGAVTPLVYEELKPVVDINDAAIDA